MSARVSCIVPLLSTHYSRPFLGILDVIKQPSSASWSTERTVCHLPVRVWYSHKRLTYYTCQLWTSDILDTR